MLSYNQANPNLLEAFLRELWLIDTMDIERD